MLSCFLLSFIVLYLQFFFSLFWYRISRGGYPSHEASSLVAFRNFDEEMKRPGIWDSEKGSTSTAENSRDNLASLYRPPFALMHQGSFEKVHLFSG